MFPTSHSGVKPSPSCTGLYEPCEGPWREPWSGGLGQLWIHGWFLYLCVSVFVCVFVSGSVCLLVCPSAYAMYVSVCLYLSACVFICACLCVCVCLCVCMCHRGWCICLVYVCECICVCLLCVCVLMWEHPLGWPSEGEAYWSMFIRQSPTRDNGIQLSCPL